MKSNRIRIACIVTFVLARGALAQSVPAGFAIQSVVLGPFGSQPVGFAFVPDGRIVLIEKDTGNVRLAPAGGGTSAVIATIPSLTTDPERGLLGVAADPSWPTRPYLYFFSTHTDGTIHITLYVASGDLSQPSSTNIVLGSPYLLLQTPDVATNHNGGTLRFGPDGKLYASLGDDAFSCDAQDLAVLRGKILRLDVSHVPQVGGGPPALGDITPSDNPFSGADPKTRLVFAYGLRNPYRFTIDSQTNDLYIGDVGLGTWEEIDELHYAGYAGNNYGWPEYEGPLQDPDPSAANCSQPPFVAPIYFYPNPPGPPVSAVTGGPLYRRVLGSPVSFGWGYDGSLFFSDFYAGWMRRLVRSGNSWVIAPAVPGQPNATDWAANLGWIGDIQTGPDGAVYCVIWPQGTLAMGLHRIVSTTPVDVAVQPARSGAYLSPNPARRGIGAMFEYRLVRPSAVTLRIFDITGRLLRTLPGPQAGGTTGSVCWDGRTQSGGSVPPGLYPYRLQPAQGQAIRGKIAIVP